MQAKIIQIGNSYGIRLPREYIRQNKLALGQLIQLPNKQSRVGNLKAVIADAQLQAKRRGKPVTIDELVAEQRAERQTWQTRLDKQDHPSS